MCAHGKPPLRAGVDLAAGVAGEIGAVLDQLGFQLPPKLAALDAGDTFSIPVSRENVDILDSDVFVMLTDDAVKAHVDNDAVLAQLPVAKRGALIQPDINLRGAMTYNTVLSAPYAVKELIPALAKALNQ